VPLVQSALMSPTAPGVTPPPDVAPAPAPLVGGVVQPTSPLAIWSLVCGCLTLLCGLLAAIPAIVLGHLALGDIKKNPGRSGRGLALAGLIIGYVMGLLNIAALCFYLAFLPTIIKAAKEQSQSSIFTPTPSTSSSDNTPAQTTNSDQPAATPATNSPDQSTNSATATPTTSDQSTNSSTPSTNAPDSSTNAAPASQ